MAKGSGSLFKASVKAKRKKSKGDGLSSLDAANTGIGNINPPPASASELKTLLKKSLEDAAAASSGVANAAPDAETDSPLLVRADTTTPRASPEKPPNRKQSKKKNGDRSSKKKHERETLAALQAPVTGPLSATSTPRDGANSTSTDANAQHHQHLRISGRVIQAMGTLRTPVQRSTAPSLSSLSQSQVQSLAPIAKKCWIELFVERSDELPFGVYSRPQVAVHLVDRFTGRAVHQTLTTSRAKLNYLCSYANAFKWYQSLRFPVTLVDFLSPQTLLLFELFEEAKEKKKKKKVETRQLNGARFEQLASGQGSRSPESKARGKRRRIAWAFYSPVSEKGSVMLRTLSPLDDSDAQQQDSEPGGGSASQMESCMRLQLYEYQLLTWMDQYQGKAQWPTSGSSGGGSVPAVFLQYQKRRRAVVPSTLYVDIRPIIPPVAVVGDSNNSSVAAETLAQEDNKPEGDAANRPSEVDNNQEPQSSSPPTSPTNNGSPGTTPPPLVKDTQQQQQMSTLDPLVVCRRSPSEPCLVPHRVLCRLPTAKKGCSCVSFSACGLLLAAAINPDAGEFLVQIYHVNSSQLLHVGHGHRGMIYSLEWDQKSSGSQRLISTSSDGTARLWDVSSESAGSTGASAAMGIWQHTPSPCFVYCGIFHPVNAEIALTAASDGLVRFWSTQPATGNREGRERELARLRVSDGAAVHSVRIEPTSGRLFCGDALGTLTVWKPKSAPTTALVYELIKTIHTGQTSITSLQLHPRKQHLLVHTQPNGILQYELRSYLLLNKSYAGVVCEKLLGKSVFSPDGRFVVSGSENGVPLLFASVQGQRFQRGIWGKPFFHQYPVMDVSWSSAAHIVALCSYGGNHPIVLLCSYRTDEDLAQHLLVASTNNQNAGPQALNAFTRELAQEKAAASSGAVATGDDHSERVQRALERRRQRLQAKLALETDTVEAAAHASI
ncbi:Adenylate cyclase [Globisporangium polare]